MKLNEALNHLKDVNSWIDHDLQMVDKIEKLRSIGVYTEQTYQKELSRMKTRLKSLTHLRDSIQHEIDKCDIQLKVIG